MPTKEDLQKALKAFKKRLKVMQRDDESTLGVGPMSSGKRSGIAGIGLPTGFTAEVWEELIKQGRIRKTPGASTYELIAQKEQERL